MTTIQFEVLYYDKSKPAQDISTDTSCDKITIYDAGDSFAEYNITKDEWKYWQIIDSEVVDNSEATYIGRIIRFIGYDIVPSNILATYNVLYKGDKRGEWALIQSRPWKAREPVPPFSEWKNTSIEKKVVVTSQSKKVASERPPKRHVQQKELPPKSHQYHAGSQSPLSPHSQHSLHHSSLTEQLLVLQKLQQQILSKQMGLQSEASPPPSRQLVPLMKPGSSSTIPLVPSSLLPARTIL